MLSMALLYILAVVFSATRALPLYPEAVLTPQEELLQKLVAEVEEGQSDDLSEQRDVKNVFPLLLQRERDRDTWPKETTETLQQPKVNNMVDDLKAAVLKLAAADKLRSQGFLRSEQNLPKPSKR
ncbi:hypothetical protein NFI96_012634, partial [Prochilodus magdalenae]